MKKTLGKKPAPREPRTDNAASQHEPVQNLVAGPADESQQEDRELALALDEFDSDNLARAKALWFFGEWKTLAELDLRTLRRHPQCDRFALLAASAHQQLGDHKKARECTGLALEWGCPPRAAAQVLVAGVHNTLGRIAALKQDEPRIFSHFEASVAIDGNKETALVSHARSVREMARMGLLPQATCLVDKKLQETKLDQGRPEQQQARIKILETELSLLHHELSLAQQRQQLFRPAADDAVPTQDQNNQQWLEALKKKAVSQLGQDLWVLEKTSYKRGGFFVEFGATDGVMLSNTWLLEKEFGWKGICAEPNPDFYGQLKNNRQCKLSDQYIGGETGKQVEFILSGVYGGSQEYAADDDHADKRTASRAAGKVVNLTAISLNDFLEEHGAPREIDYLSVDTEGSEFEILNSFRFDKWDINLITVEHNFTQRRKDIRKLLESNGYHCLEMQFDDWYYKE